MMCSRLQSLGMLVSLLIGCCWGMALSATAQEVHFRFNRAQDFPTYISTSKHTQIAELGARGKRERVRKSETKVTSQKTKDGYSIVFTPVSLMSTVNGKPYNDPIIAILKDVTVTYQLDENGQLVDVHGYGEMIEVFKATLGRKLPPAIEKLLSEETFVNKAAQEWGARIGSYVGMDAEIGDVWAGIEETPLPTGGTMAFYMVTKLAELVKCGAADCVRIEFSFASNDQELKDLMGDLWSEVAEMGKLKEIPNVSNASVAGRGERIIDPATMMIYSETIERTIDMTVKLQGQEAVEITSVERREYGSRRYP